MIKELKDKIHLDSLTLQLVKINTKKGGRNELWQDEKVPLLTL